MKICIENRDKTKQNNSTTKQVKNITGKEKATQEKRREESHKIITTRQNSTAQGNGKTGKDKIKQDQMNKHAHAHAHAQNTTTLIKQSPSEVWNLIKAPDLKLTVTRS